MDRFVETWHDGCLGDLKHAHTGKGQGPGGGGVVATSGWASIRKVLQSVNLRAGHRSRSRGPALRVPVASRA